VDTPAVVVVGIGVVDDVVELVTVEVVVAALAVVGFFVVVARGVLVVPNSEVSKYADPAGNQARHTRCPSLACSVGVNLAKCSNNNQR